MASTAQNTAPESNYRWYVLGMLTLAQTSLGMDRAIIGLVLKPIGDEFHLTGEQMGLLAGIAFGLPFALAAIPFGYAVDRFNRKKLLTFALVGWSGATALTALATGLWGLLAGRAAVGAAEAGGSPTGLSILSDYFGAERRATAVGLWYLSSGFGFALAFFVGGWIVMLYGWRTTLLFAGLPGLILAPFLYFTLREPKRGTLDKPEVLGKQDLWGRVRDLCARPGILMAIAAVTCIAVGIYGMSVWIATFLVESHDFTLAQAGLLAAVAYGVLGSIGGFSAGWGVDRLNDRMGGFDPARTALVSAVFPFVTAIAGIIAMATDNATIAVIFILITGLTGASYNGPLNSVFLTQAGPNLRGLAVSIYQMSANLIGVGFGAWLIGKVSDMADGKDGVALGIGTALVFCLIGSILLLFASRQIKKSELQRS